MKHIDIDTANRIYSYNPDTGLITRKVSRGGHKKGTIAGCVDAKGYVRLSICDNVCFAHRVAWVMHHGKQIDADMTIDHINGDKADNRICNLRVMSNANNPGIAGRGGKKPRGIAKIKDMWRARVIIKGKQVWGTYRACPLIAHIDYLDMIPANR